MSADKPRILLANLKGQHFSVMKDLLKDRGYEAIPIDAATDNMDEAFPQTCGLIVFEFADFSPEEFGIFQRLSNLLPSVPKVAMSQIFSARDIFKLGRLGVNDFFIYPILPVKLHALLEKFEMKEFGSTVDFI